MGVQLNAYLYFKGKAREAMEYYKNIFGGDLDLQTFADVPDAIPGGINDSNKDRIMHASLKGGDITLMASDSDKASPEAAKIELSLMGSDESHLREIFEELSEGGKVNSPLKKEFWGDIFGNVTDKYGITWMIDITPSKA